MKKLLFILAVTGSISCFAQEKEVRDAMEKKYGEPGMEKMNEWLAGMSGKVEPEYNFPMSVDMTMVNYRKKEPQKPMQMTIYVNNDKGLFGTKMNDDKGKNQMIMVVDQENNNIVMLNEKEKTAMAINTKTFMATNNYSHTTKEKAGSVDCKKTGKTKTIEGYNCEEYVCTNSERNGRYEIYVTDKVKFDFTNNDGRNNPFADYFKQAAGLGGMMMEGKFYEKDELQATVIVNNVNTAANYTISTTGYKTGLH